MPGLPILKATGLQTAHNPFSGVSDGALRIAKNITIFSNGVVEPRRGHRQLSYTLASKSASGTFFGDTVVTSFSTSLAYDTGSAFSTYAGTFTPPDDTLARVKFVEAKEKLFFTDAGGIKALDSASSTPRAAGLPKPLVYWGTGDSATSAGCRLDNGAGPGTWITNNTQIAFRFVYGFRDASGTEILSPPSDRILLINASGGGRTPHLQLVDPGLPDDYFVRLYRTDISSGVSAGPGDEQYLIQEIALGDVDTVGGHPHFHLTGTYQPRSELPLYTNPRTGADGTGKDNFRPPAGKELSWFGSRLWVDNTYGPQRFFLDLLGTGSPDGVQAGDTLTIGTTTFTASAGPASANEFYFETGGTAAANIQVTARKLVDAINGVGGGGTGDQEYRAFYVPTDNSPGKIVIEYNGDLGADPFVVYASRPASWSPYLTTTSTGALTSSDDARPNGSAYSKPDQPEAFPLLNYLVIGAKNKQTLRAITLRDKRFVFKEDGIYTVAGEEPFTVDLLDATTRLVAPDTAVVLNNQILALTNQGVVAVSDAGVQILSRPIEDLLIPYLNAAQRTTVKRHAFAVAHETDRTYELWVPGAAADSQACTTAFVFSPITQTWTTWEVSTGRTWGAVSPTDVRYYGGLDGKVLKERRDFASSDYADETRSVEVLAYDGTTLTLTSATGVQVGDSFTVSKLGAEQSETITAIDGDDITISNEILSILQSGGTTIAEEGIAAEVKWGPVAFDRPGSLKRFQYGTYHFLRPTTFTLGYATYSSEQSGTDVDETVVRTTDGWGSNAWDSSAWGDPQQDFNVRHIVPMERQRGAMLSPGFRIREARTGWKLLGLTLDTEETSERNSGG